ncbi:uncharacterized protein DEA37_0008823 [Paragonimus westermani]|uniref:Secretion-regulating guanine nucleotide exchange factor n=1 Tax=Paragonimus westermani TaxID=34504 RepID=A0A5J4N5F9_9TREM|nr:uncharacterized protein DEA37_0008823 [Paragonimus westermani]
MALIAGTFRDSNGKFTKLDFFTHHDLLLFSDWSSSIVRRGDHNLLVEESGINQWPPIFKSPSLKVKSVACGSKFLLCLTPVGQVFSKGVGSRGQLGLGDLADRDEFTRIEALEVLIVTSLAAGAWHSACVTDTGDLYTWGWNEHGQLGHRSFNLCKKSTRPYPLDPSDAISVLPIPKPVDTSDEDVTEVACGSRHTAYLTNKGSVYVCGWNGFGQLGFDPQIVEALDSPTLIKLPTSPTGSSLSVRGICCGLWTTILRLDE